MLNINDRRKKDKADARFFRFAAIMLKAGALGLVVGTAIGIFQGPLYLLFPFIFWAGIKFDKLHQAKRASVLLIEPKNPAIRK